MNYCLYQPTEHIPKIITEKIKQGLDDTIRHLVLVKDLLINWEYLNRGEKPCNIHCC